MIHFVFSFSIFLPSLSLSLFLLLVVIFRKSLSVFPSTVVCSVDIICPFSFELYITEIFLFYVEFLCKTKYIFQDCVTFSLGEPDRSLSPGMDGPVGSR